MRDKDLYAQILGIKSPWQVSGVELALSEGEVTVHVEQEEGVQHCCPTCGEVSPGYDSRKRKWRHLDTCQGLLIPSIWAYRSLSLIGDYDNLPTPFGEEPNLF